MTYYIRKFNPETMKPNTITLLVGKRGTGKSTLLEDICFHLKDKVDFAMGMSPTEDSNNALGKFMPPTLVHEDYREDKLVALMELQKRMHRMKRGYSVLIVLDDCCYDKKILRSRVIREIFMNGRHRKITLIITAQYVMDLPPDLRTQIDYVMALRENVMQVRERLWKQFFGFFESRQAFGAIMDSCTENYACLVCDNKSNASNNVSDCVFWHRAPRGRPPFKIGRPAMWSLNSRYYKPPKFSMPTIKGLAVGGGGGNGGASRDAISLTGRTAAKKKKGAGTMVVMQDVNGRPLKR